MVHGVERNNGSRQAKLIGGVKPVTAAIHRAFMFAAAKWQVRAFHLLRDSAPV